MNFVNDYILFKLLFDNGPAKRMGVGSNRSPRPPSVSVAAPSRRSSLLSNDNRRISDWRGSCIDVSHLSTHLPIKQRLQRKRSGSWSAGTNTSLPASMMTIAEGDECSSRKQSICPSTVFQHLEPLNHPPRPSTVTELKPPEAIMSSPKIVVSTVRKKLSYPSAQSDGQKLKEKLHRKRSSCPNTVKITAEIVDDSTENERKTSETQSGHRLAVTISPSMENAEYSLLTSYLQIYRSASRDDETAEEERDSVVLHLGYNYPDDLLWNRGSRSRSPSPKSSKRKQLPTDPPVGDLINFSDSGDDNPDSDTELEELLEKSLKISRDVYRSSNPETLRHYHKKLFNPHIEAEYRNSEPIISKSYKSSSTSRRSVSTVNSKNSHGRYKIQKEYQPTPETNSHKSSAAYKTPSRSSDNRRSVKITQKRSPSAPSPRGGSFRRRPFSTEDTTSDVVKIGLSPRNSRNVQEERPLESPVKDLSDIGKVKQKVSRTHSSLLQPVKLSPESSPELLLTLSYSTSIGFITITINKAKNLSETFMHSFVKVMLFENHRLLELKETSINTEKSNPEYNQAYMFGLGKSSITNINFVVEVWGHSLTGEDTKIGHVVLGVTAGGSGSVQWIRMVKHIGFPAIMWHKLAVDNEERSDVMF